MVMEGLLNKASPRATAWRASFTSPNPPVPFQAWYRSKICGVNVLLLPCEDALPVVFHADNHPAALLGLRHKGVRKGTHLRSWSVGILPHIIVMMHQHHQPRTTAVLRVLEHLLIAGRVAEGRHRSASDH